MQFVFVNWNSGLMWRAIKWIQISPRCHHKCPNAESLEAAVGTSKADRRVVISLMGSGWHRVLDMLAGWTVKNICRSVQSLPEGKINLCSKIWKFFHHRNESGKLWKLKMYIKYICISTAVITENDHAHRCKQMVYSIIDLCIDRLPDDAFYSPLRLSEIHFHRLIALWMSWSRLFENFQLICTFKTSTWLEFSEWERRVCA